MTAPFDKRTIKEGPLTITVAWHYDDSPDVSHLGEGTSKPDWNESVYDRWTMWLWVHAAHRWYDESGDSLTDEEYVEKLGENASGDRRSYRYIHAFQNNNADEDDRKACFADAKRLEGYYSDQWYMTGCEVTITVDGEELASASLWSIESDSGKEYLEEVERDMLDDAKDQARNAVEETAERLEKLSMKLRTEVAKALEKAPA